MAPNIAEIAEQRKNDIPSQANKKGATRAPFKFGR
jgi:hypothetical protein